MSDPIFDNLSQALYISFIVEGMPEGTISSTKIVIDSLKRRTGFSFDEPASKVKMGRLNRLEIRGQYAMIRAAVNDHLREPERYAIWARYGRVDAKDAVFRKVLGVEGIAAYVEYNSLIKGDALLALTANFYKLSDENAGYMTMQQIADEYEIPLTNLARAKRLIGQYATKLELQAFDRLYALFNKEKFIAEISESS